MLKVSENQSRATNLRFLDKEQSDDPFQLSEKVPRTQTRLQECQVVMRVTGAKPVADAAL